MNSQGLAKLKLPDTPGIYFFKTGKRILYIGKATSLRDRVRSYFRGDLAVARGPLILEMVKKIKGVSFQKTNSVLEALLLEAELIKKHQPYYNTAEKDDKSWNMVVITREDFPKVLVIRQKDLDSQFKTYKLQNLQTIFGPFPHGGELAEALKIIRRIFPYRDAKCVLSTLSAVPSTAKKNERVYSDVLKNIRIGKPCFNRQIGLCPGTCTGEISKKEYARTIRNIKLLFEGKMSRLLSSLKKEMSVLAKEIKFEKAGEVKKTIHGLEHIQDISLLKNNLSRSSSASVGVSSALLSRSNRIEAYDIAHLGGSGLVGVMTVLEDGEPTKNEYRKFKIKGGTGNNDIAGLREILSRRFTHREWPLPNLIVVDGSEPQKKTAEEVLRASEFIIPVVAVVKDERHFPTRIMGDSSIIKTHEKSILLANSEAHRFAISYHRRTRKKSFIFGK